MPLGAEDGQFGSAGIAASATGTDDQGASPLAPMLAPKTDQGSPLQSTPDKKASKSGEDAIDVALSEKVFPDKDLRPLSRVDNGRFQERETGFEPATSSLGS